MENDSNKVGIFVVAFIAIIIGVTLLSTLADSIYDATNLRQSANETLDFTTSFGDNTTNAAQDDIISVDYVGNVTTDLTSELLTNINWTKAGLFTIDGVTVVNTTYNVTYNYESDNYIAHGVGRTLTSLLIIFFALAILATGLWAMYKMGLMDMIGKQ